jgi:hypothetical protein
MRRLKNDRTGLVVAVSAQDVQEFNRTWPCSNIPEISIKFEFDSHGNLIDIIPEDWRDSDAWFCQQLGNRGYRPYNVMDTNAGTLEFISYPWPERGNVFINARTLVNDPTSMRKFQFVRGDLVEIGS